VGVRGLLALLILLAVPASAGARCVRAGEMVVRSGAEVVVVAPEKWLGGYLNGPVRACVRRSGKRFTLAEPGLSYVSPGTIRVNGSFVAFERDHLYSSWPSTALWVLDVDRPHGWGRRVAWGYWDVNHTFSDVVLTRKGAVAAIGFIGDADPKTSVVRSVPRASGSYPEQPEVLDGGSEVDPASLTRTRTGIRWMRAGQAVRADLP
jgi:hypothetical protein